MKKINFFLLVFIIISCGENVDRKKNKFEYKKIEKKEVSSDKKSKSSVIILNSSDLMKFDQNELRVLRYTLLKGVSLDVFDKPEYKGSPLQSVMKKVCLDNDNNKERV